MARCRHSVRDLAREASIDLDEALVLLWDADLGYVDGPETCIRKRDANKARRALGVATRRELTSLAYWQNKLNLNEGEFAELLDQLGIALRPTAKRLPKGGVTRLKAEARRQGADEVTSEDFEVLYSEEQPPFEWHIVGRIREMRFLSAKELLEIHYALVNDFSMHTDPIDPPGLRSEDLLESALHRLQTGIGGELKYPTVESAGAALLHSLTLNHPFHNGNKRTALVRCWCF